MQVSPADTMIRRILDECQAGTRGRFSCTAEEWARLRNYFTALMPYVKSNAILSDLQAQALVGKVIDIMRANPDRNHRVMFSGMQDIQLAQFINTAQ